MIEPKVGDVFIAPFMDGYLSLRFPENSKSWLQARATDDEIKNGTEITYEEMSEMTIRGCAELLR